VRRSSQGRSIARTPDTPSDQGDAPWNLTKSASSAYVCCGFISRLKKNRMPRQEPAGRSFFDLARLRRYTLALGSVYPEASIVLIFLLLLSVQDVYKKAVGE